MTARTTRQLKQELIPVLRECAIAYDRLLCGNHTIMQCDSGLTVDILWGKENFMHLCGVHCNRPQSMFRNKGPHPSEVMFFYDQLIAGRLSPDMLTIANDRLTQRKAKVLPLLARLESLDLKIVNTHATGLTLAVGDERFAVGLAPSEHKSRDTGEAVMFPRSLRSQSIWNLADGHTRIHVVETIRICRPSISPPIPLPVISDATDANATG